MRLALRQLFKSPGYTAVAVITLALGIGLNTSMFSLMNLLILRPLPYPAKEQLVRIFRTTPQDARGNHNVQSFLDLRRETAAFLKLAAYRQWGYTLTQPGRSPENLNALRVSAGFFEILGLQPELGRVFTPEEDHAGNHVVILSYAAWMAQFGGDPGIVGQTVSIDSEPTTVVGVLPEKFASLFLWGPSDVFRPLALSEQEKADRADTSVQVLGRFDQGLTLAQLNTRLAAIYANLADSRPREQSKDGLRAVDLQSSTMQPGTDVATLMLLGLAGFVLLIVCGNLANLQMARALSRTREFAVRAALGASRSHLLRPLLLESTMLALAGGALGVLVTVWGNAWISSQIAQNLPIHFDLTIDWRVLVFASGLSLLTGMFFGLAPAWLSSRVDVNDTLKSGGRAATGDRSQHRFRDALIVLQFAAALILLSATGFFMRGMQTLLARDPGWTPAGLTHCVINLPAARYATPQQVLGFYDNLEQRLRALPGVENVGIGWTAPLYQLLATRTFLVEGREPPAPGREPRAFVNAVSPTYLETLRIQLQAGRQFSATDALGAPRVVMINEAMARALFPGENPIGRHLSTGDAGNRASAEIVGVFHDVGMAGNPAPATTPFQVFQPLAQEPWNYVTVLVRAPHPVTEPLRQAVQALDPTIPVQLLNTADELAKTGTRALELITTIFFGFSLLGLFLAALGLYGVIMRLVVQRTPEIGVRMALGAQWRDILTLIMGTGFRLAAIGAGVGLLGSVAMSLLLSAMFAGQPNIDFVILPVTTAVLVIVALIASYLPARRATKVDPIEALRAE
ncbi:ABC transporter permease [Opitutus terrae]|uniref:Permease n=1 Tax=Opitutus terrae (strain DSM 11246 / JCM 15787 / PB90-1) TaxID=452637 RepID=B1ZXX3_OPITP|nr:ABC transporter permease [Opitutus terrae]ACB75175.1 permease [Opitutus terrae PB90-1]